MGFGDVYVFELLLSPSVRSPSFIPVMETETIVKRVRVEREQYARRRPKGPSSNGLLRKTLF